MAQLGEDDPVRRRAQRAADRALQALQRLSDDLDVAVHLEEIADDAAGDGR